MASAQRSTWKQDSFSRATFSRPRVTGQPWRPLSKEGFLFFDHRVVEFAARLPPHLKIKVLNEKYLLKRAAGDLVPPQ